MCEIWTMGEMLVEIMRPRAGMELYLPGPFTGPFPSGAPTIFIDTVARLGHTSAIFGGVGKDDFGKNILDRLGKDGVSTKYIVEDQNKSTAVAFVTYFKDGSRKFIFHLKDTPAVKSKDFNIEDIKSPKFFHIMGSSLMVDEKYKEKIIETALLFMQKGAKISFDPNIRLELLKEQIPAQVFGVILKNCSVIMPGISELKLITGAEEIESGISKLFEYPKLKIIALKKGFKGSTIYTRNEKFDCPAYKVDAVDPTGSGDCFDAAFLCGLLESKSLKQSAQIASAVGALNSMKLGPMEGEISIKSVEKLINSNKRC